MPRWRRYTASRFAWPGRRLCRRSPAQPLRGQRPLGHLPREVREMPLCQLEGLPAAEHRPDVSDGVQQGNAGADLQGGCVGWIGEDGSVIDPAIDSVEVTG